MSLEKPTLHRSQIEEKKKGVDYTVLKRSHILPKDKENKLITIGIPVGIALAAFLIIIGFTTMRGRAQQTNKEVAVTPTQIILSPSQTPEATSESSLTEVSPSPTPSPTPVIGVIRVPTKTPTPTPKPTSTPIPTNTPTPTMTPIITPTKGVTPSPSVTSSSSSSTATSSASISSSSGK